MSGGYDRQLRILGSSEGTAPGALRRGAALVLDTSAAHAVVLEQGVLLDDWLGEEHRARIDTAAVDRLVAWADQAREALRADGVDLAWMHAGELYGDVFLRELRIAEGVRVAVAGLGAARVWLEGVDARLECFLRELLDRCGVTVSGTSDLAAAPSYPVTFATSIGRDSRLLGALRRAAGVPGRPRGHVLVKPQRHTDALWKRLDAEGAPPVLDLFEPPSRPARELMRIAAAGGWVGHPGGRTRRHASRLVAAALGRLAGARGDPLDRLIDDRARRLLAQRAPGNLAGVLTLRRAFAGGSIRAAVMPSDGSAGGRIVAAAAAEHGVRTVHVQHGFFGNAWHCSDGRPAPFIDGLVADRAAVWSDGQAATIVAEARGEVVVTGNPGAPPAPRSAGGRPGKGSGRAVLLVQPPIGPSTLVDARSSIRHARTALEGLRRAGFEQLVLRPHPLDPCGYERRLAAEADLPVTVARGGPLGPVLEAADVCVGSFSTGILEAAVAGIPTVFLDGLGGSWPWPLDGSGAFPAARTADELTDELEQVRAAPSPPGADAAAEALGVRPDALDRIVELLLGA